VVMTATTSRPPTAPATPPPIIDFWPSEEEDSTDTSEPEAAATEALDVVMLLVGLLVVFVIKDVDTLVVMDLFVVVDWLLRVLCDVDLDVPCLVMLVLEVMVVELCWLLTWASVAGQANNVASCKPQEYPYQTPVVDRSL
jgi:hypothetical protein